MANARIQDGALGAADPFFYMLLVRDGRAEGNVFRVAHWLSSLVNSFP